MLIHLLRSWLIRDGLFDINIKGDLNIRLNSSKDLQLLSSVKYFLKISPIISCCVLCISDKC